MFQSKWTDTLKIILGLLIILVIIYYVDLAKLKNALRYFSFQHIIVLLLLTIARNFIGALRFSVFTSNNKYSLPYLEIVRQYFIGSFYNTFFPGNIGGDAVRLLLLNRFSYTKTEAGIMILSERLYGLIALLIISFISMFFFRVDDNLLKVLIPIILLAIMAGIIVLYFISKYYQQNKFLQKTNLILTDAFRNRDNIFLLLGYSIIYQLIAIFISYYIALTINVDISFVACTAIIPIIWLATLLPITFGGNGIRELSFVYLFGKINIAAEDALIISLGTYFTLIMSGFIGLFLHLKTK